MIYFEIRNNNDIIVSNIRDCSHWKSFDNDKNKTIKSNGENVKSGFSKFKNISVWIIVVNDIDLLKSSKLFKRTMRIYGEMAESFLEYYLHKIRAHSHTLRSIQGKMKQKMESLAKRKDFRGQNYFESKKKIFDKINNDVEKAADVLCYLNKRISEIDVHIEGFDVLYMGDEIKINKKLHDIKKVLQNIIAPSLYEFNKISINVNFHIRDDYSEENKIYLDYKLMNLAFVNFFDNAIKYSKPYSEIDINFEKNNNNFKLEISMVSLRIERDELDKIFEDGYVGNHSTSEAGDGIGMYVIKKSLGLMNIGIKVVPDYAVTENYDNKKYVLNKFIFESVN